MHERNVQSRKHLVIDANLHHRLDLYATATKRTMREVAEEAIVEKLDRLEAGHKNAGRCGPSAKRTEALTA